MIPVTQTRLHAPGEPPGNCYAACLATLLELPIEAIPHPDENDFESWNHPGGYNERLGGWLNDRGFHLLDVPGPVFTSTAACVEGQELFYIASGPGPRGTLHAVVYRNLDLIHDPHPEGGGLLEVKYCTFLVPNNPATSARREEALREEVAAARYEIDRLYERLKDEGQIHIRERESLAERMNAMADLLAKQESVLPRSVIISADGSLAAERDRLAAGLHAACEALLRHDEISYIDESERELVPVTAWHPDGAQWSDQSPVKPVYRPARARLAALDQEAPSA